MMIDFSHLESITGGKLLRLANDRPISQLITDSRKRVNDPNALFFAISGPRHDGHQYAKELYDLGVRQFVVEKQFSDLEKLTDANVLLVTSSIDAIQSIARFKRNHFVKPVIAITGSNGKTIVKEWLYQLLSPDFNIAKNPGSYNSQLGVPLSVWQLREDHDLGIFEAGISKPNEMEKLASVIHPTIGIFTNIGSAHDEGFKSRQDKIDEKLLLFKDCSLIIHATLDKTVNEAFEKWPQKKLTWGFDSSSSIQIRKLTERRYKISYKGTDFEISLPFSDSASVENCFHCIAGLLHFKIAPHEIQERILSLRSVPMRMELKEGINQSLVIDDTYNNDLAGLKIALEFLSNQQQKTRRRVILSDVLESGVSPKAMAQDVARLITTFGIQEFVGIGKNLSEYKSFFSPQSKFFDSTDSFLRDFDFESIHHEIILVKGARVYQFEKIVERIQKKVHGTIMEIDLGALVKNLNFFRSLLQPRTKIMVMVKAFAYGSGSVEIANLLQFHRVDYLGVAYTDEGVDLRKNNITLPIMVMNPAPEAFESLLSNQLEPEIYNFKILNSFLRFLNGRASTIHVKVDTGMHRLGFDAADIDELISILISNRNLHVASIFSHLAASDEPEHDDFSFKQAKDFQEAADKISTALGYKPFYHILNSAGILRLPRFQFDMVRLGIGLYGVNPTEQPIDGLTLVPTLKTIVSQVKHVAAGETIGYGRRGVAKADTSIATIAVGYADGFSRAFSRGVGKVMINGKLAPVIGNVCMDMTMVDVSGVDVHEGDAAIIFGRELPIQQVAKWINTIPYEILTSTSERVKRLFVAESM